MAIVYIERKSYVEELRDLGNGMYMTTWTPKEKPAAPDWQTRMCGAAEGAIHEDDDHAHWIKRRGQWARLPKDISDNLHYAKAAEVAVRDWNDQRNRGFGERDAFVGTPMRETVLFSNPPPPTHAHTLRLPTADTDARLGCARWWP